MMLFFVVKALIKAYFPLKSLGMTSYLSAYFNEYIHVL